MKKLRRYWPLLLCVCAPALGCDALPKLQLQLQSDIRREFAVTYALVLVVDTNLVVAVFDDARAERHPKELIAFQEQVAGYAVRHYRRGRVKGVVVLVSRATEKGGAPAPDPEPALFLPEYHPDGSVRMAPLPPGAIALPADRRLSAPPRQ
jgi:hypothetical protein